MSVPHAYYLSVLDVQRVRKVYFPDRVAEVSPGVQDVTDGIHVLEFNLIYTSAKVDRGVEVLESVSA
ncbi:hypothetical protein EST38_g9603 [Candolleomyces aberdarensis]|uniref:Uncharacterized protein n=1 Tax=Candolleomyces aberdarensis TaxID=2316362 RepID=A0A4Q2DBP3_9AGAR|nr:hypothetical protein EST38_g9603 [Candolleomyces aberdarensis]